MQGEPGSERVADLLPFARISAVNLGEVAAKLHDYGLSESLIAQELATFELPVVPFDEHHALRSGALRVLSRSAGLSMGDRACIATAELSGAIAVTGDRVWASLDLPVTVELFR